MCTIFLHILHYAVAVSTVQEIVSAFLFPLNILPGNICSLWGFLLLKKNIQTHWPAVIQTNFLFHSGINYLHHSMVKIELWLQYMYFDLTIIGTLLQPKWHCPDSDATVSQKLLNYFCSVQQYTPDSLIAGLHNALTTENT